MHLPYAHRPKSPQVKHQIVSSLPRLPPFAWALMFGSVIVYAWFYTNSHLIVKLGEESQFSDQYVTRNADNKIGGGSTKHFSSTDLLKNSNKLDQHDAQQEELHEEEDDEDNDDEEEEDLAMEELDLKYDEGENDTPGLGKLYNAAEPVFFREPAEHDAVARRYEQDLDDEERFQQYMYAHQHPVHCDRQRVRNWKHKAGIGSVLQLWKNTFLRALNENLILASGFKTDYLNSQDCPTKFLEDCLVLPISNCRGHHFPTLTKSTCALANVIPLSERAGLKAVHGNTWFHAQVTRYIMRPRPIVGVYKEAIMQGLQWPDLSRLIAVHVRHGDIGQDGRKPIPTIKYAHVLIPMIAWGGYDGMLVGSDDRNAVKLFREYVANDPTIQALNPNFRVEEYPNELFELANDGGWVAKELQGKRKGIKVGEHESSPVLEYIQKHRKEVGLTGPFFKDEGAAIMAQIYIMAEAGSFIGTLNSNFGRTVYDLAMALPREKRGIRYDMENRPYFGCSHQRRLPVGGANVMYPYDH